MRSCMRWPCLRRGGFSIAEAVIAAIVFVIAVTGVLATIGNIKKPSARTDRSLTAAYVGQQVLEAMRTNVDAGTWDDPGSPLSLLGTHSGSKPVNGVTYTYTYTVVQDPISKARRVTITVNWPDN